MRKTMGAASMAAAEQKERPELRGIPVARTEAVQKRSVPKNERSVDAGDDDSLELELFAEQLYFEKMALIEEKNSIIDLWRPYLTAKNVLKAIDQFKNQLAARGISIDVSGNFSDLAEIEGFDLAEIEGLVQKNISDRKDFLTKSREQTKKTGDDPGGFIGLPLFERLRTTEYSIIVGEDVLVLNLLDILGETCVNLTVTEEYSKKQSTDESGQTKKIGDLIRHKTEGLLVRNGFSLEVLEERVAPQLDELQSGEKGALIDAYTQSIYGEYETEIDAQTGSTKRVYSSESELTKFITQRRDLIRKIKNAAEAKTPELALSDASLAARRGLSPEKVVARRKRLNDAHRFNTGKEIASGSIQAQELWRQTVDKEFFAAYVKNRSELRDLWLQLHNGVIVETPYVKEVMQKAMSALKKDPPGLVYLHGDHGTGKTALATHIGRKLLREIGRGDEQPIIISANKFLEPDKFTDDFQLRKLGSADMMNEIYKQIHGQDGSFSEKDSAATVLGEMGFAQDQLRQIILENRVREDYLAKVRTGDIKDSPAAFEKFKHDALGALSASYLAAVDSSIKMLFDNPVQGKYALGAMYHAMKNGIPLIIDEANALTPEVAIAFNDLYTKKIGATVEAKAGAFKVKKGFCIMWTGNTGERFSQARYELDAAAYSRIVPIRYRYLPQSIQLSSATSLTERITDIPELSAKDYPPEKIKETQSLAASDQIFQVLLVKLLNNRQGVELLAQKEGNTWDRYAVIKELRRLSEGAKIIMDLFEGNEVQGLNLNLDGLLGANDQSSYKTALNIANLTMRELLDKILSKYIDNGMALDLEYQIWEYIQNFAQHPQSQAVLYKVLKLVGFFETKRGVSEWPDEFSTEQKFKEKMEEFKPLTRIPKYIKMEENGSYYALNNPDGYQLSYISSIEIMQMVFGVMPARGVAGYEKIKTTKAWQVVEAERGEVLEMKELMGQLGEFQKAWKEYVDKDDFGVLLEIPSSETTAFIEDLFRGRVIKFFMTEWWEDEATTDKDIIAEIKKTVRFIEQKMQDWQQITKAEVDAARAAGGDAGVMSLVLEKLKQV